MTECFKGEEIDFEEIIDPNVAKFRDSLFSFLGSGLGQGPSMPDPSMPINAPNDPNFALGMNMFREMGGQAPNYQPYQAPQNWNPQWNPQWPPFSGYGGPTIASPRTDDKVTKNRRDDEEGRPRPIRPGDEIKPLPR